jgi:hypothetical protein
MEFSKNKFPHLHIVCGLVFDDDVLYVKGYKCRDY